MNKTSLIKKIYWLFLDFKDFIYYYLFLSTKCLIQRNHIHAYVDFRYFPISFNFFEYLVYLECKRRFLKKDKILLNIIIDYSKYENDETIHVSGYKWRFFNICINSTFFFKNIKINKIKIIKKKRNFDFNRVKKILKRRNLEISGINQDLFNYTKFIFDYIRGNDDILDFDNSTFNNILKWLKKNNIAKDKIITLSIRTKKDDNFRNTNVRDWVKFSDYLKNRGYFPIIIDDVEGQNEKTEHFNNHVICEPAMYNIIFRLHLIKISKLNYFTNSGPSICSLFFDNNYVFIKPFLENANYGDFNNAVGRGYTIGKDIDYKNKNFFRIIKWEDDNYENLIETFERFENFIIKKNV